MANVIENSLQREAISAVDRVPIERLPILIQFARFLSSPAYETSENNSGQDIALKRKRIAGSLKGKIMMADDFNETPDCFKEYL